MITNISLAQDAGATAAPPTIEPVLRLPLRLNVDGSMAPPVLDFGDASSTLHVVEQASDGWWPFVIWHAPTAAAALLLVAPLVLCVVVVRTARRKQQFGHYYCRKCNYDLTGPGGMPPEAGSGEAALRCPECGAELRAKPARLARSFTSRVWKSVLCAVLLMMLCAVTLLLTLERSNPSNSWMAAWMEPVSRTGLLPRLVRIDSFRIPETPHVSIWSVPDGKRMAELRVDTSYPFSAVTKDGEWFVWCETQGVTGCVVHSANLRTEARSVLSMPTAGPLNVQLVMPSVKRGHVIVGYTNSIQGATNEALLTRIDLATGKGTTVGRAPLQPSQLTSGGTFVFREHGELVRWAYIAYGSGATPGVLSGTMFTAEMNSYPFELSGKYWMAPTMTPDGLSVDVHSNAGTPTSSITRILLADGSQTTIANGNNDYPPSLATDGRSVVWQRGIAGGQLQVRAPSGEVIGVLGVGTGTPNLPVISRDGHWAAASVTIPRTTITGSPAFDAFVYVWDLQALNRGR